jgi:hypothetical protein
VGAFNVLPHASWRVGVFGMYGQHCATRHQTMRTPDLWGKSLEYLGNPSIRPWRLLDVIGHPILWPPWDNFSFKDVLREQIQKTRSDIHTPTALVELARQFGDASGTGKALRSALDVPNAKLLATTTEPPDRGAILVAAVFNGSFKTYRRRMGDLIRIATGGSGALPEGDMHPDLVNRIAAEASATAQRALSCANERRKGPTASVAIASERSCI